MLNIHAHPRNCMAAAFVAMAAGSIHAAQVTDYDWANLNAASKLRAVPVLIDLLDISMTEIFADAAGAKTRTKAAADALIAELGEAAWAESLQVAPGGQATVYLTSKGLLRLQQSGKAIAFQPSPNWTMRSQLTGSPDAMDRLAKAAQSGAVDVIATLDIDGLSFETGRDGSVTFTAPAGAKAQAQNILDAWSTSLYAVPGAAATVSALKAAAASSRAAGPFTPEVRLRLSERELVRLAMEPSIRSLRLAADTEGGRTVTIAPDVAEQIAAAGTADVLVFVRRAAPEPCLNQDSMAKHLTSVRNMLGDIARVNPGLAKLQQLTQLGMLAGTIDRATLDQLAS